MRRVIVPVALMLIPLAASCGGSTAEYVSVAPASHTGGVPVPPSPPRGERDMRQGPPHPGAWSPTREFKAPEFTVIYPASARAYLTTDPRIAEPMLWIQDLPECTAACDVIVHVWHAKATVGLDSVVKVMTSKNPDTGAPPQARVIDSTTIGGHRTIRLDVKCGGNCSETNYVTERHHWVAEISLGICTCDADLKPMLEEIVRSFRWRDDALVTPTDR
jgi:hypothetical protein